MCLYIHKLSYNKMYLLVQTLKPLVCMHKKLILLRFGLYTRWVLRVVFSAWRLLADILYSTNGRFFPTAIFFRLTLFLMGRIMLVECNLTFISYSHIYMYVYAYILFIYVQDRVYNMTNFRKVLSFRNKIKKWCNIIRLSKMLGENTFFKYMEFSLH